MSIVNRVDNIAPKRTTSATRERGVEKLIDNFTKSNIGRIRNINSKRNTKTKSKSRIKDYIEAHIAENIKEYLIVIIIFIIGITLGVIFINNVNSGQAEEIKSYINNFINAIKDGYNINSAKLLKTSLADYLKLVICMWFIGSTVIGMPIMLGIVLFRGFCIGYTVSSALAVLGTQKGIIFFLSTILLQNIIFIPVLLSLAVSGINLYKSIMKDKRKENIKLEIIRHTVYSIMLLIVLVLASFIEAYISSNFLALCINFF